MPTIEEVLRAAPSDFSATLGDLVCRRCARDGFKTMTPAERVAYCVDELEREINNGGFDQYFFNSSGNGSAETLSSLEAIGAHRTADLLRRAIARFPGGAPPADRLARQELLDSLPDDAREDNWSELDTEFQTTDPDGRAALMRAYVEAHRTEFRDV